MDNKEKSKNSEKIKDKENNKEEKFDYAKKVNNI